MKRAAIATTALAAAAVAAVIVWTTEPNVVRSSSSSSSPTTTFSSLPSPAASSSARRVEIGATTTDRDENAFIASPSKLAAKRSDLESVDDLVAFDIVHDPELAPAVIEAMSSLAKSSAERRLAARTLAQWLTSESRRAERGERDAIGNVPNIIEALGALAPSTSEAVDALVAKLEANESNSDVALGTLIVQQLGQSGDRRARSAIDRFLDRIHTTDPPTDDFERQLHEEAIAEGQNALEHLGG